ncbi:uncharacterized protein LOC132752670 [Ruditapes philippinarum]|uniref:uncharacterized protein LOC132752670 n=1 Tax=Ruditapes philippinarum TaxID=129788 RepID=UPI00295C0F7B|nr:uncharacterized protein LOC132752670 [Ruditapes philippinarum]
MSSQRLLFSSKDIYFLSCPCSDGLNCKGEGRYDIPLGELGTCVKPCFTSDDCGRFECCVSLTRPIAKRFADLAQAPGECEPLGKKGTECLVNNGSGRPDGIVFKSCPCKKRLTCVGSGDITIPLGESGVCQKLKKKM